MEQVTVVLNMVFSFYLVTYESYIYVTALITHVLFFFSTFRRISNIKVFSLEPKVSLDSRVLIVSGMCFHY